MATDPVYVCSECDEAFSATVEARTDRRFVITCPQCGSTELARVATDEEGRHEGRAA
jgi:DNA-directed RNA polymerase subunit RPC12/RpoP